MSAKRGHVSADDAPAITPGDWDNAFVTRSVDELRATVTARRTRGPNRRPTKEQVAVRYSPEVLENRPLRWEFLFYKPTTTWHLIGFTFDAHVSQLFNASVEATKR